ncbi:MAG: helix-turn-helix domain-containing protein [Betaproteobacteria bacterium]|nr:helix-turn-helix domain-containing protein [Betaproteobacteria bacterium]
MTAATSTEDVTLGGTDVALASTAPASPGAALAQARQKLGLSVGDIAAKLRMSVVQIDAMERGEYGKLPTGTFLRGFVRSYAKLVGLDAERVLQLLEDTHADSRRPTIVVPTQNIKMSAPGEKYSSPRSRVLLALVLLLAISAGGVYWWLEVRPGQAERLGRAPIKVVQETLAPAPSDQAAAPAAATEPLGRTPETPATRTTQTETPATTAPPDSPVASAPQVPPLTETTAPLVPVRASAAPEPAKPAVPKGSGSLRFAFTAESWVEVVDASGRTLVSRRFQSGEGETVIGKLPLSVVIGNATVTKLKFNDIDFDLAPHTRVSVARFTLK